MEICCLEGYLKEAGSLINQFTSGYKKANAEGLLHFMNFRFSFDKSRESDNVYDIQGPELYLLNSKKSYQQSQNDYNNNIQAVLGLTQIAFFQKNWKEYTVKFSLLRNQLKNKVRDLIAECAGV